MELRHICGNTVICKATISNLIVNLSALVNKVGKIDVCVDSVVPKGLKIEVEENFFCTDCGIYIPFKDITITCEYSGKQVSIDESVVISDKKQNLRSLVVGVENVEAYIHNIHQRYPNIEFEQFKPEIVFVRR